MSLLSERTKKTPPLPPNLAARNYPEPKPAPEPLRSSSSGYLDLARELLKTRTPNSVAVPSVGADTLAFISIAASLVELVELQKKSR
jgi:hypothetical protein